MAKLSPLRQAARKAARVVYPETALTENGQRLYDEWAAGVQDVEDVEFQWDQDWPSVKQAFLLIENALANLNRQRLMEGDVAIDEHNVDKFFSHRENWQLAFVGELSSFELRIWTFLPWESKLAFVVVEDEEDKLAEPTALDV